MALPARGHGWRQRLTPHTSRAPRRRRAELGNLVQGAAFGEDVVEDEDAPAGDAFRIGHAEHRAQVLLADPAALLIGVAGGAAGSARS
jgi:hypothetical protein